MKATDQVSKTVKDISQAAKAKVVKKAKPASRKLAASAKRTTRAATKRLSKGQSTFAGYSDSASRLIARGKAAFGDAYAWAGEASHSLPRSTRISCSPRGRACRSRTPRRAVWRNSLCASSSKARMTLCLQTCAMRLPWRAWVRRIAAPSRPGCGSRRGSM